MGDPDGPTVTKVFYSEIFENGEVDYETVPYALDAAGRELRLRKLSATRWATYIHMGT